MKLPTVPSMGSDSPPLSGANTGYVVQAHADDLPGNEAPQTYHAVSCIACGGTHLVDLVTGEPLVPRPKRESPNSRIEATEAVSEQPFRVYFPLTEFRFGCR